MFKSVLYYIYARILGYIGKRPTLWFVIDMLKSKGKIR